MIVDVPHATMDFLGSGFLSFYHAVVAVATTADGDSAAAVMMTAVGSLFSFYSSAAAATTTAANSTTAGVNCPGFIFSNAIHIIYKNDLPDKAFHQF